MKTSVTRSLCASALAVSAAYGHAEGVHIYALLDASVSSTSVSSGTTPTGATAASTNRTEFVTGGYAPSFIGIEAEKDLGQGFKGGYKLEQGFLLNSRSSTTSTSRYAFGDDTLFNRNANLWIAGSYGRVTAGTQSNIAFNSVLMTDPRGGSNYGSALAALVISGGLNTVDSGALNYQTPSLGGVTLSGTFVPESTVSVTSNGTTSNQTQRAATRLSATYAAGGPMRATLAYYRTDIASETEVRSGVVAGMGYRLGQLDLKALYARQKNQSYDALTTLGLGGSYAITDALSVDAGYYNTRDSGTDYKLDTAGVGVQYKFLKDLKVYAQYTSAKNSGSTTTVAAANFAASTIDGGVIYSGQTANTVNIGLLYSFF